MSSQELYDAFKWQEFVVEELFEIDKGTRLTKTETLDGNLPYISATSLNNGVDRLISNNVKTWNNAISIVTYGEPGISFYHPYTFGASDSVCVISLKNKELNPNLGVFLCTSLEKLKPKYSYGKGLNVTRLKAEKIWLPVTSEGKIDFEGIDQYMNTLYKEIVPEIKEFNQTKQKLSLDSVEWEEFVVEELFKIERGSTLSAKDIKEGSLPFITATTTNNGVNSYISNNIKTFENKITVAANGRPGVSFYHPYVFGASGDVNILTLKGKELNKYSGLFLSTSLEKLQPKYSYGKKLGITRLKSEKIWLPITENGDPNYQFMEDYIKSLSFSEILN